MFRRVMFLLAIVAGCLTCISLHAQDPSPRERLIAARGQYYTPTTKGLTSFHCDASIDWKAMLTRLSGVQVTDDNPFLKYVETVHLSVTDQLKGIGTLDWTDTTAPPQGKEAAAQMIRNGLRMMMAGFFQSWNAYMTGKMVPYPAGGVTVTRAGDGVHLHARSATMTVDEDFDKNMLLTKAEVAMPTMHVVSMPTYQSTDDGLVVSAITSLVNQPPTAPQKEVTLRVDYAPVDSFRLPSHVTYDIKNVGLIDFSFDACHASVNPVQDNSQGAAAASASQN